MFLFLLVLRLTEFHTATEVELMISPHLTAVQRYHDGSMGRTVYLSNEKRAPGCLGDLLGMKNYPVI